VRRQGRSFKEVDVAEEQRQIGRYVVREYTARRLAAETRSGLLTALGVTWGIFLVAAILIAPWRGGSRFLIAVTTAIILAGVSLLVIHFVPRQRQFTVDVETGVCRIEQTYMLSRTAAPEVQVPLAALEGVRCRCQVWQDGPGAEAARWLVELVGQDDQVWRLAEGAGQEPMQELARLVAEVAGCPTSEDQ
jgi:hypothetical protein